MSEEQLSGGGVDSAAGPVCPWCSAALPSDHEERCPSCGAALHEGATSEVPGVTRIDHEALLKGRPVTQKPRGIIGWLSGEYEAEAETSAPGTLEPPDHAVRREMLRLELAALEAEVLARRAEVLARQAEVVADVATETGEPANLHDLRIEAMGDVASDADIEAAAEAPAEEPGASSTLDTADDSAAADAGATEESRGA